MNLSIQLRLGFAGPRCDTRRVGENIFDHHPASDRADAIAVRPIEAYMRPTGGAPTGPLV